MVALSKSQGHDIIFYHGKWVYIDTKEPIKLIKCKRCGKRPIPTYVKIPADLSSTGEEKWKYAMIDACIAPIVKALQEGGIDMRGSCCGHGKENGTIELADRRLIVIYNNYKEY